MMEENTEKAFRDEFAERVKNTTLEQLPALLNEMIERDHDYGTICVAMGMAAATAAWAMNKHPNAGITGFQAGAIAWEFLRHWEALYPGDCGGRMQSFNDLLYPQYEGKFTTITKDAFSGIQRKAQELLAEREQAHPNVIAHWRSVAEGKVPFGLKIQH